ncbi:hypothetical protein G9A89_004139 [Geosiphon pyriformis]|nr:hypothetical protein G9A89_004139 [Geosiphon pyriformis]
MYNSNAYNGYPYTPPQIPALSPDFDAESLYSKPQKYLRFRNFHTTHFSPHRQFFLQALDPNPQSLWSVPGLKVETGKEWKEGYGGRGSYSTFYKEGNIACENEEVAQGEEGDSENLEFVLNEETIAMFRFSEIRKLEREKAALAAAQISEKNQITSSTFPLDYQEVYEPSPEHVAPRSQTMIQMKEMYGESGSRNIIHLEAAVNAMFRQSLKNTDSLCYIIKISKKSQVDQNNDSTFITKFRSNIYIYNRIRCIFLVFCMSLKTDRKGIWLFGQKKKGEIFVRNKAKSWYLIKRESIFGFRFRDEGFRYSFQIYGDNLS